MNHTPLRTRVAPLALLLLAVACGEDERGSAAPPHPEAPEAAPEVALDPDDPSACESCHAAVVEEWRTSMHARAHHDADPLYGAMRRLRMGREGEALAARCAQCHGPRAPERPDSAAARVGVGCAACHLVASVDMADGARKGAHAVRWADGLTMRGPHDVDAQAPAPHGVGAAAPWLTDGRTMCLTCHQAMQNAAGVDTCTTGTEHTGAEGCASCHMPAVEGASGAVSRRATHRSHAFLGPHQLYADEPEQAFMASAVTVTPTLEGTSLRASLRNESGHAMPTGFPGRVVFARATGYDAEGRVVWRSFESDPMAEDPDAVFGKVYVDAQGEPALPPYAASIARDSRLDPGETRELRWTVPEAVTRAELVLLFRLLPPPAARQLGLDESPLAGARPFLTVTVP